MKVTIRLPNGQECERNVYKARNMKCVTKNGRVLTRAYVASIKFQGGTRLAIRLGDQKTWSMISLTMEHMWQDEVETS